VRPCRTRDAVECAHYKQLRSIAGQHIFYGLYQIVLRSLFLESAKKDQQRNHGWKSTVLCGVPKRFVQ